MNAAWTATLALVVSVVCAPAAAQSLVDAAKRAEAGRKSNSGAAVTFDERDVNPAMAARELLVFEISEQRWKTYVAADNRVMDVMEKEPALYGRLEMLRASSPRMIERFLLREPDLVAALQASGTDAHEYAYTSVAIGLALAINAGNPDPAVLERLPQATKANMAFVLAHDAEIKGLLARGERVRVLAAKTAAAGGTEKKP